MSFHNAKEIQALEVAIYDPRLFRIDTDRFYIDDGSDYGLRYEAYVGARTKAYSQPLLKIKNDECNLNCIACQQTKAYEGWSWLYAGNIIAGEPNTFDDHITHYDRELAAERPHP